MREFACADRLRGAGMRKFDWRVAAAIMLTVFFWASAFVGIRGTVGYFSPGGLALTRFAAGSAALLAVALATRMRLPDVADWPRLALVGFLGITVYNLGLNYGSNFMQAGSASFLINTAPIFTAVFATFMLGERLKALGWAGILVSFVGVVLIFAGRGKTFSLELGAYVVLLAAVVHSLYFILQKPLLKRYSPLQVVCAAVWFGTVFMIPFALDVHQEIRAAPPAATLVVVYLGVFAGAVAFATWSFALSRIDASQAASFLYCVPPTTIVIAWLALGELPALLSILGGGLALAGVVVVNTWGRQPAPAAADAAPAPTAPAPAGTAATGTAKACGE